ncbi:MAG: hypothetical protein EBZ69_08805, partial [Alphaproteobacteria bacterium]|nr:hypothetical protein [Alphaproteobacteria bacterium]
MLGAVGENFFALSWLIAGVVVLGSFAALWALVCNGRQLSPHHRSVFALTLACFVYYMICPDEPYHISMWPYRFLLFSTPVALVSLLLSLSSFRATITIPAAALAGLMFVIASYIALVDSEWIAAEANKRQQELISQILASNAKNCLMHMPGTPRTMQDSPSYRDATSEVGQFLRDRALAVEAAGIA